MKLVVRVLIGLVALVVVLAIGGFLVVALSVNTIAKKAIEEGGTYAMGVPTTLDSASVGILSGEFGLKGLEIANPPGFGAAHFFTLGNGEVAVDYSTLKQPTVELPVLTLEGITASLERKPGSSNYQTILDNIKKATGGSEGADKPPSEPAGQGKKFVIKELAIRDVKVHVDMLGLSGGAGAALNKVTEVVIPIDEITLSNVGQTGSGVGGTGVEMGELVGIVVRAVMAAAVQKGGDLIPAEMLGDLQGSLASFGDMGQYGMSVVANAQGTVRQLGEQAEKVAEEAQKAVEQGKEAVEKVGEGLKDLIPKKP